MSYPHRDVKSRSPKRELFEEAKASGLLPFLKGISERFGKVDSCELELIDERGEIRHFGYQIEVHHITNFSSFPLCTRISDRVICRVVTSVHFSHYEPVVVHLMPDTNKNVGVLLLDKESNLMNSKHKRTIPATGY